MGGGPSKADIEADREFMLRVQKQQNDLLAANVKMIQDFFATVDDLVKVKGSPSDQDVKDQTTVPQADQKKVQDATKTARDAPKVTTDQPTTGKEANVVYKPDPSVIVLLNQASVVYQDSISNKPEVLTALVDTVQKTVNDILGTAPGGAVSDPKSGAQVPSPLLGSIKTLFAKPEAIKSVTDGVFSVAKILLSSMESNVSVSSTLLKKIEFIAPGMYAATYYATSQFQFTVKGLVSTKNLSYSLSAGGLYLVTSPKLIQIVASLQLYREIADSFQRRLKQSEEKIDEFTGAISDSAYFSYKFGFTDADYNNLMKNLKTEVMKDVITNFWQNTRDYSNPDRTKIWNDYVNAGQFKDRIEATKSAYTEAYNDLRAYYNDFVLKPPVNQN